MEENKKDEVLEAEKVNESEKVEKEGINTDELKNETANTVKQVKESMKNVNVKEEAKATKGFVTEMFKNPLGKIKEIANDSSNKYFKTAIVLIIIWAVAALISSISFRYFSWVLFGNTLLAYIKTILAPVIAIIVMSLIIFVMNKKSKKSLVTVITTVTTAKLPIIAARIIGLLTIISSNASTVTSRVSSLANVISAVFMFFAIKELYDEKEEKTAVKTFVIVEAIYYLVAIGVSFLGISI